MKSLLLAALILVSVTSANSSFPEDPADVEIIDRAYCNFSQEASFYIRMFNTEGQGIIELLKGTFSQGEWKWTLLYSWQPALYSGSPRTFESVTLLSVYLSSDCLFITWIDRLNYEYQEGLGSLYLQYDPNSGELEEILID